MLVSQEEKFFQIQSLINFKKSTKFKYPLHFTLIDPEKQSPKKAGLIARQCELYGTDAFLVGGSTVKSKKWVYETIKSIKAQTLLPVIFFPNSASTIPENADFILFLFLLNSLDVKHITQEQLKAIPKIREYGITPISCGYIVFSQKVKTDVEIHTKLDEISLNNLSKASDYAILAEIMGLSCIYLEAGSGAKETIPPKMVSVISALTSLPIIVGGGIRDEEIAYELVEAGASIIVTGNGVEKDTKLVKRICDMIK